MPSVVSMTISFDPTKSGHKGSIQSNPPTSPDADKKSSWTDHVEAMLNVKQVVFVSLGAKGAHHQ